jgi:hypothetical protein
MINSQEACNRKLCDELILSAKAILFACVMTLAATVSIQQPASAQEPTKPTSKIPLAKGAVEGSSYKNDSLGLELTPARGLTFGAPELKGTPGTVPLLVTIAASSARKWFSARDMTVFYADDLGYYRNDRRSTEDYVRRATRADVKYSFAPINSIQAAGSKQKELKEALLLNRMSLEARMLDRRTGSGYTNFNLSPLTVALGPVLKWHPPGDQPRLDLPIVSSGYQCCRLS